VIDVLFEITLCYKLYLIVKKRKYRGTGEKASQRRGTVLEGTVA
jgi:hypothetical protein